MDHGKDNTVILREFSEELLLWIKLCRFTILRVTVDMIINCRNSIRNFITILINLLKSFQSSVTLCLFQLDTRGVPCCPDTPAIVTFAVLFDLLRPAASSRLVSYTITRQNENLHSPLT